MWCRLIPIVLVGAAVSMLTPLSRANDAVHDFPSIAIFRWVAGQMQVAGSDPLPPIHYVSRSELRRVFQSRSKQSFKNWQAAYGLNRARQIMDDYLKGVVGMFNPNTGHIYVGRFLSPCRQKAVLVHELTHYFQNKAHQDNVAASFDPALANMILEMEAYRLENRFMDQYCPEQYIE